MLICIVYCMNSIGNICKLIVIRIDFILKSKHQTLRDILNIWRHHRVQ